MKLERQVLFWIAALVILIGLIWLLHDVLLPFVAGMALAYLLDPLANRIERLGVNRIVATLLIMSVFALLVVLLVALIVPLLAVQMAAFVESVPEFIARLQALVMDPSRPWLNKLVGAGLPDVQASTVVKEAAGGALVFIRSLWSGGRALVSLLSLLVVTPVVAFYLLCDWKRIVASVDGWLPREHADTIRGLAREINSAIAGFVRGQIGICTILATLYVIGFAVIGLRFGFLIGVIGGMTSFIPYVGSFGTFLVATCVALAQFWPDWTPILMVVAVCVVCQGLEGYVLSPYLVGSRVGLHPVWLMFALFAFYYLFGFVGLLVAIPVSAAVGVLVRFGMRRYLASQLYSGESA